MIILFHMTNSLYIHYFSLCFGIRDYLKCLKRLLYYGCKNNVPESHRHIPVIHSDQELMELLNTDKEEGFRALYDRYYTPLVIYAIRLTDSQGLAEDVVQELFISIWKKSIWQNIKGDLRRYLFGAVRNNALAQLRKNGYKSIEELSDIHCEIPDDDYDTSEMEAKRIKIEEELRQLPLREFEVVQKVIMDGKRYIEAAQELNISVNTLKTHLSRATIKLRKGDILF